MRNLVIRPFFWDNMPVIFMVCHILVFFFTFAIPLFYYYYHGIQIDKLPEV